MAVKESGVVGRELGRGGMDGSAAQHLARVHCSGGTCHVACCHVITMMWGL